MTDEERAALAAKLGVDEVPADYEECGECGYDHSYNYEAAYAFHLIGDTVTNEKKTEFPADEKMAHTVTLGEGKYAFDMDGNGLMIAARRHGEPWPAGFHQNRFNNPFLLALHRIIELGNAAK